MDNSMPVQLEVIEPSTLLEKICVGNSYFTDDTWDKQYDIFQLNVVLFKYTNEILGL